MVRKQGREVKQKSSDVGKRNENGRKVAKRRKKRIVRKQGRELKKGEEVGNRSKKRKAKKQGRKVKKEE